MPDVALAPFGLRHVIHIAFRREVCVLVDVR
jgi:hypothetical protein